MASWIWLLLGVVLTFCAVVLITDHALYPGNPGTDGPSAQPPQDMIILRDITFFILTIVCMLTLIWTIYQQKDWTRSISVFAALNAAFFVACLVYVFVYRYKLSASAQAGSTASNFYYATISELGFVMIMLTVGACRNSPWDCANAIDMMFQKLSVV